MNASTTILVVDDDPAILMGLKLKIKAPWISGSYSTGWK